MRTAAYILTLLVFELGGVWFGYERGYRLGVRHGIDLTISELEQMVAERVR